jgi:hypothetical protein
VVTRDRSFDTPAVPAAQDEEFIENKQKTSS